MKTAISIPDPVFSAAEELARRLSVSRSELYTRALREFLAARNDALVTHQLNELYGERTSALDPALAEMQRQSVDAGEW